MLAEKTTCSEKTCKRCGWCCTSLGKEIDLSPDEDEKLKRQVFNNTGVIYLRTLRKFFLAVSLQEKNRLLKKAEGLGITADIKPNKIIYDRKNNKAIIYDWYLDHSSCPFYSAEKKACLAYDARPSACRQYPSTKRSYLNEVLKFIKRRKIDFSGVSYDEALKKASSLLNHG